MKLFKLVLASLSFATLVASLPGCGEDTAEDSCEAMCEAQGAASGCPDSVADDVEQCQGFCGFVSGSLSDDCRAKAEAYWSCGASEDWSCSQGSQLPQLADDEACEEEAAAYADCVSAQ